MEAKNLSSVKWNTEKCAINGKHSIEMVNELIVGMVDSLFE